MMLMLSFQNKYRQLYAEIVNFNFYLEKRSNLIKHPLMSEKQYTSIVQVEISYQRNLKLLINHTRPLLEATLCGPMKKVFIKLW